MKNILEIQQNRLDELFSLVSKISDDELKSHMTKYLCIQVSGYLENVVKILVKNYITKACPKPVENFITFKIEKITNLDNDKLSDFLNRFSAEWVDKYNESISDQHIESLNSIVSNRNLIAHGRSSGINYSFMKSYYEDLKEIVIILEEIIHKRFKDS